MFSKTVEEFSNFENCRRMKVEIHPLLKNNRAKILTGLLMYFAQVK